MHVARHYPGRIGNEQRQRHVRPLSIFSPVDRLARIKSVQSRIQTITKIHRSRNLSALCHGTILSKEFDSLEARSKNLLYSSQISEITTRPLDKMANESAQNTQPQNESPNPAHKLPKALNWPLICNPCLSHALLVKFPVLPLVFYSG